MPTSNNPVLATPGIIGGSGLYALSGYGQAQVLSVATPYADIPVSVWQYQSKGQRLLFVPRHGPHHSVPPHLINYRANIWALKNLQATGIVAINTVGGITAHMQPGVVCLADQIIDYTWGRTSTFYQSAQDPSPHVDFTCPFDAGLRQHILDAANRHSFDLIPSAVYACTQGPRLETAAEIIRLARDGCDIVGMTGMPEAILARELELPYSMLALVVNTAAGLSGKSLDFAAMQAVATSGLERIEQLLDVVLAHRKLNN